jgi:hypothetical protein
MNIDSIITEWTYRLEKGYPDCPEDYQELRSVLQEMTDLSDPEQDAIVRRAMGLTEDEESNSNEEVLDDITDSDLKQLQSTIKNIAPTYAKYLKIFNLFDPNSLGTISEVLLAKLINQAGGQGERIGASQGLTDVIINGKPITLKTTNQVRPIMLGTDLKYTDTRLANQLVNFFNQKENKKYLSLKIKDLLNELPNTSNPETSTEMLSYTSEIENRITSIAKKLSGDDEYFVWAAKEQDKTTKAINSINLYVLDYQTEKVIETLYNGYLYVTDAGAWGVSSEPGQLNGKKPPRGTVLVQADNQGKFLNITPIFIRQTIGTEKAINIPLIYDEQLTNNISPSELVSNKILNVLNDLANELFGQASDGENDNLSGTEE